MSERCIELAEVRRDFTVGGGMFRAKRALRAVNGVSLAVQRGEVLGLVGESGCGKSTLARMLLGLLAPSAGEIRFDGRPLAAHDARALARRVQPVFQDPYASLNPRKHVASIIGLPLAVHGIGTPDERARQVEEMMERVGLARRLARHYPNQLSGGQRQRAAIARAIVMGRRWWSATSRLRRSTFRCNRRSSTCSPSCAASSVSPTSLSATTSRWSSTSPRGSP